MVIPYTTSLVGFDPYPSIESILKGGPQRIPDFDDFDSHIPHQWCPISSHFILTGNEICPQETAKERLKPASRRSFQYIVVIS